MNALNNNLRYLVDGYTRNLSTNSDVYADIVQSIMSLFACLIVDRPRSGWRNLNILPADKKHQFAMVYIGRSRGIYQTQHTNEAPTLTCAEFDRDQMKGGKLRIQCLADFEIDENGGIDVTALGYEAGTGAGCTGGSYVDGPKQQNNANHGGGGGGHSGGYGTAADGVHGGQIYGDKFLSVLHLGSGGGCNKNGHIGGAGGGAIYIETYRMVNNGCITADGGSGNCCGSGSGGSIHVVCSQFVMQDENAYLSAVGGNSRNDTPGVGRIRIECKNNIDNETLARIIKPHPFIG
eukprot:CAMPEP_0202711290 /NCGR_PEP_ID=MMETSP1385-20130828/23125_1 /ASSEMBLY_ACC=CAM_ASM_000861 /TAXON_ID=933848 /ORGANISM="Elphidium margaritaceum" /LENGTH=291 /DNA_ID=CAMNT_0049370997 /DNA_START=34 /DNA_END=909 /DNA_ORIENTATION=-